MIRHFVTVIALAVPVVAWAEPVSTTDVPQGPAAIRERLAIPTPPSAFTARTRAGVSPTIYLERCRGNCQITIGGVNDARALTSTIPRPGANCPGGTCPVDEFRNAAGLTGAAADAEWAMIVQCMKEVYSPFAVNVTDVKPADGSSYHLALVAGIPQNVNLDNTILGVAPLSTDCSPQDNVISFSFANQHGQAEITSRVNNICWTASQESAHAFGLDHQYSFIDRNRSACNDPMTYRVDCGGEKFFRNENANCGEDKVRPCRCGSNQNSHVKLTSVFGAGQSIVPAPSIVITSPATGSQTLGTIVAGNAGSKRGVDRVEVYFNDFKWAEAPGAAFGPNGQMNPAEYGIQIPKTLPNSIVDVRLRAYDDLGNFTDSETVTVTKGAPCATAEGTCLKGQKCEAGKCFWDPPVGEQGDDCAYDQYCKSSLCRGTADQTICTTECVVGVNDSCPEGYDCIGTGTTGVCFFPGDGGCCSVGNGRAPWAQLVFASFVLGLLVRPWRRRRR
jgi:hypothetical protein